MSKKIGTFPICTVRFIRWMLKTIWHKKVTLYGRGSRVNCVNSHKDLSWKRAKRVAIYIKERRNE